MAAGVAVAAGAAETPLTKAPILAGGTAAIEAGLKAGLIAGGGSIGALGTDSVVEPLMPAGGRANQQCQPSLMSLIWLYEQQQTRFQYFLLSFLKNIFQGIHGIVQLLLITYYPYVC